MVAIANAIYNYTVKYLLMVLLKNKVLVWGAKKLSDYLAKPLYDYLVRKGYLTVVEIKAEKAQENLEKAKSPEEINKAIDEIP